MAAQAASRPRLPFGLSEFCGRQRELEELGELLASARLVTIKGVGGVGKSRLAVEVAATSGSFPDGVWLVELARITAPELVPSTIAASVHAPEAAGASPIERATRALEAGRQLLILDNCEHVVEAAAVAARQLIANCPGLSILATSRDSLGLEGERVWPIPPLDLPQADVMDVPTIAKSAAVQLFCDRARRALPDFGLSTTTGVDVATICRRLDGLPLAIELAAAWVPILSMKQIILSLDENTALRSRASGERPLRHQTIRAALDWSFQLLNAPQQAAFARLSVFVGGFTLEGAAAVLAPTPDQSPLELVASLVDHSLLAADTTREAARYRFLEPVRQFAADELRRRPQDEDEARRRQLRHLMELAETAEEPILGGPDLPWMRRLDDELPNIRASLAWGFESDSEHAARLSAALIWFCYIRSMYQEGRAWAERAMVEGGRLRARAAHMAGNLAGQAGDAEAADRYLAEARELATKGHWQADLTMVLFDQAILGYHHGDLDAMRSCGDQALRLARELRDEGRIMQTLIAPAILAQLDHEPETSCSLLREAITIAERRGAEWSCWIYRNLLVETLVDIGDRSAALEVLRACLDSSAQFGDAPVSNAYLVENAGIVAIQSGDANTGLRLMAAARAVFDRWRYRETPDEARRRGYWREMALGLLEPADAECAWAKGRQLTIAEAIADAQLMVAGPVTAPVPTTGPMDLERGPTPSTEDATASAVPAMSSSFATEGEFVRAGDYWSLTFGGHTVRLRDSKGLRDIVRLIATPGREIAAVDLTSGRGAARPTSGRQLGASGMGVEADAGEVLDSEARAQYRARLTDLEEEIDAADAANDPERAGRAREEREFLLAELSAAVGLSGRPRRALDPAERARKAVTWRIRDALNHVEAAHAELGRHLRRSVRTGGFCVYEPAEPTVWRL